MDPDLLRHTLQLARTGQRVHATRVGPWEYLRFNHKFRFLPEGAVVFGEQVIWGYPKIGRILHWIAA